MHKILSSLLLAVLCVSVCSCGYGVREVELPRTGASLEGTVKYGADTIYFAMIIVEDGKNSSTGRISSDGRYKVENVPVGEVFIAVNTDAGAGMYTGEVMSAGAANPKDGKPKLDRKLIKLPAQFQNPKTSGLKHTVAPGANTFDIVIPK